MLVYLFTLAVFLYKSENSRCLYSLKILVLKCYVLNLEYGYPTDNDTVTFRKPRILNRRISIREMKRVTSV